MTQYIVWSELKLLRAYLMQLALTLEEMGGSQCAGHKAVWGPCSYMCILLSHCVSWHMRGPPCFQSPSDSSCSLGRQRSRSVPTWGSVLPDRARVRAEPMSGGTATTFLVS